MAGTFTEKADGLRPGHPLDYRERRAGTLRTSPLRRFFGVVIDPDSYRNIAYLLLGLPLGILWFTVLVTGVSVAASMLIVALIGIPMLVGMWYLTRVFANVERCVANALLHQHIPYAPITSRHRGNLWVRLRAMSQEQDRWHEAAFLMLRFPAGIATFTAATTALSAPLLVVWAPFDARLVDHPFGDWALSARMEDVAMSPWSWSLVPLGLLLLVGALHLLNRLARACGRWTTSSVGADTR